jgi:hypothetical protein
MAIGLVNIGIGGKGILRLSGPAVFLGWCGNILNFPRYAFYIVSTTLSKQRL